MRNLFKIISLLGLVEIMGCSENYYLLLNEHVQRNNSVEYVKEKTKQTIKKVDELNIFSPSFENFLDSIDFTLSYSKKMQEAGFMNGEGITFCYNPILPKEEQILGFEEVFLHECAHLYWNFKIDKKEKEKFKKYFNDLRTNKLGDVAPIEKFNLEYILDEQRVQDYQDYYENKFKNIYYGEEAFAYFSSNILMIEIESRRRLNKESSVLTNQISTELRQRDLEKARLEFLPERLKEFYHNFFNFEYFEKQFL